MSTTSLSSCDDCDYSYKYVLEDSRSTVMQSCQGPFYKTMGQPLVYYAEFPYCSRSPNGRRKENRNVFVRAFNWYTQERELRPRQYAPEMGGFAMWLDAKYGEYLRESECIQSCGSRPAQGPSTNDTVPCHTNEPNATKIYSRMRSPWRKFRGQNRNAGDMPCKTPNGSCQFILQPKDLTRPASECYYQTTNCPIKSNATVISTEIDGTKKTIVKSQSMTSICHENITCIDLNNTQEGPKHRQCRVVEKAPQVTLNSLFPCDQSCRIKQEGKTGDTIQIISAKVQKTDIPGDGGKQGCKPIEQNIGVHCNPDCCETGCKPREQIRPPAKTQNDDPNRCKHECKPMGEIRVPVQAQKFETPHDTNCSKPAEELRTSTKQQKIEMNYDPNCGNQEIKPTGDLQIALVSHNVVKSSSCRQECNPTKDIQQDLTKSQIKDIPCDPNCIYKQKPKPVRVIRETVPSKNTITPCDPNCSKPDYKPSIIQRIFRSQIKDIPCKPSCIYMQNYKPAGEMDGTPSKPRRSKVQCMCYPPKSASQINKAPSRLHKIDHESQCPQGEALPIVAQVNWESSRQTITSTSINNSLCKCIFEKAVLCPVQAAPPFKPIQTTTKVALTPFKTSEVACQCPENDIIKLDMPSQYNRCQMDKCCVCDCPSQAKPVKPGPICNMQRPDSCTVTSCTSLAVKQVTRSVTSFRSDGMQTSDHSICLEDVGHDYAFFMKIVCADKLNDCVCDSLIR